MTPTHRTSAALRYSAVRRFKRSLLTHAHLMGVCNREHVPTPATMAVKVSGWHNAVRPFTKRTHGTWVPDHLHNHNPSSMS